MCLSMAGLGMRLVPLRAIIAGLVVFAAINAAFLLSGSGISLPALASEDVGVAFIFAVGAFTRSTRLSQDKARAAQARAGEDPHQPHLRQDRAAGPGPARRLRLPARPGRSSLVGSVSTHGLIRKSPLAGRWPAIPGSVALLRCPRLVT